MYIGRNERENKKQQEKGRYIIEVKIRRGWRGKEDVTNEGEGEPLVSDCGI